MKYAVNFQEIKKKVVARYGSLRACGEALGGIRGEAVGFYFSRKHIPAERARQLVDLNPDLFTLTELRPDLWREDELK